MGKVLLFFFSLLSKIVEKLFEVNLDTKGEGGPRGVGGAQCTPQQRYRPMPSSALKVRTIVPAP